MYRRILAPLDGSEFSECILQHVKAVATGCQVPEVVFLRVLPPLRQIYEVGEESLRDAQQMARSMAEDYLTKVADNLKKDGIAAQTALVVGNPAEEILDYASKNQADLIAITTHGRSGVTRWVLGSVADRVLRHSTVPVLLVSPPGCRGY